jgi:hypothetical protein
MYIYVCTHVFQISQTPGGRENAKMFSKSSFSAFSLEHGDRNHFLRPDRILGAFQFHRNKKIEFNKDSAFLLSEEIKLEKTLSEPLGAAELLMEKNLSRVRHAFEDLWRKDPNNMLEERNRAGPEQVPRNAFQRGMSLLFRTLTGEAQDDNDDDANNKDTTLGSKPEQSVDEEASLPSLKTNSFNKGSGGGGGGGAQYVEMVSTHTAAAPNDASMMTKKDTTLPAAPVIAVPFKKLPSFKKGGYRTMRIIYIYINHKNIVSWLPTI